MLSKPQNLIKIQDFKALYFLSDAHLGESRATNEGERLNKLFAFGRGIANPGNHLFIIGDLFDFWFEWGKVIPKKHFQVLHEIAGWREWGLNLYYLPGNHDFRLKGILKDEIGFYISDDTIDIEADGKRFHLFHGDGIQKSDVAYRLMKRIVRSPINQKLFSWLHPDLGLKLAEMSSSTSREAQSGRNPYEDAKDYMEYAQKKFDEGFDFVVMGHTHLPLIKKLESGVYLNSGEWFKTFSYGMYRQGNLSLEIFQGGDR